MATKHTKAKGTQQQIKAQNEEISYLKSKAYQLIATNKNLRKELENTTTQKQKPKVPLKNNTSPPTKKKKTVTKYTTAKKTYRKIKAQNEEISYVKNKIYQLITTNKNFRKELNNANREKWQKVENRKTRNKAKDNQAKTHSHIDRKRKNLPRKCYQYNSNDNFRYNNIE